MPPSHRRHAARARRSSPSASARVHFLIEWLRSGRRLTTTLAARALGVSRRTIARDLAHIRQTKGFAVHYDAPHGTYRLDAVHTALPFIPHPDLLPSIISGTLTAETDGTRPPDSAHLRFSERSVRAYEANSGIDLSHATHPDGHLDVFFEMTNRDALVRWVLSGGGEAEIVAPESLRQEVVVEIRRMLSIYEGEPISSA